MEYEYVFGTNGNAETLKIKGRSHTDLTGFQQVVQEYPDQTITDRFRVVRRLKSDEDQAGNCYDWYEIDRHYRMQDRTGPVAARVEAMTPGVEAAAVAFVMLAESGQIDAVTAGERAELFPEWAPGVNYAAGQLRRQGGTLYQCLQAHTAQEGWEPENTAALWRPAYDPAEEWPAWSQPICAVDAYAQGDRVFHAGAQWCSDLDNNVWEPGVYGWTEYTEEG